MQKKATDGRVMPHMAGMFKKKAVTHLPETFHSKYVIDKD
jgi:hypothetical protein